MEYLQTKIILEKEMVEIVTEILSSLEIDNLEIDDPNVIHDIMDKKESYEWDYIDEKLEKYMDKKATIAFYNEVSDEILDKVKNVASIILNYENEKKEKILSSCKIKTQIVSDEQWKDKWKEFFKPTRISQNIVVKPTWEKYEKKDDEKIIEVDPGMAFGTGAHETTSMCVILMEKYVEKDDKILDVGCGSGILSIAGSMLGAKKVLAIDIDEIAVSVSKENVQINNCSEVIDVQLGDLTKGVNFEADIVVANLTIDLIKMLTKYVEKHLGGKKIFITSGILLEKEKEALENFEKLDFEILEILRDGDWCAIVSKAK